MSIFSKAVLWVIDQEGGLHDDPKDPGGLTNFGIALKEHPELTADDIRHMTIGQAMDIYHAQYWIPLGGDALPVAAGFAGFDCAVNQGVPTAKLLIQQAAGVTADGVIGPETLNALRVRSPEDFLARFTAARIGHYSRLSTWPRYGDGWTHRAVLAALEASKWASSP